MEKQRITTKSESCKRLLKSLLVFSISLLFNSFLSGQSLSASQINKLRIKAAENQNLYAKTELRFEVILPGISASLVQVQNPEEIAGVNFKSLRKTELFSDKESTKIEIWFTFDKKGSYRLPNLSVMINGRKRSLQFDPVEIDIDPATINARALIKFSNGQSLYSDDDTSGKVIFTSEAGKTLSYTIYLQYAVQLIQFNWDLPKNSILTQTKNFEITELKYRERNFSDELIPVASFDWTPLTTGKLSIPPVSLIATGNNGMRSVIVMPDCLINVSSSKNTEDDYSDNLYVEAFNSNYIHSRNDRQTEVSLEECKKLAEYRSKEKFSFSGAFEARKERSRLEEELNLPQGNNEFSIWIFYISLILFITCLIIFILFIKMRKALLRIISGLVLIIFFALSVFSFVKVSSRHGIFTGGNVYSVPDPKASSSNKITAGTRIKVLEITDQWCYIEIGDIGGWVEKDKVIKI